MRTFLNLVLITLLSVSCLFGQISDPSSVIFEISTGDGNKGEMPASVVQNWAREAAGDSVATAVRTSGNESIDGVKTFTSFSVTPSSAPSTDYQVANKKYVDDEITGTDPAFESHTLTIGANNADVGISRYFFADSLEKALDWARDSSVAWGGQGTPRLTLEAATYYVASTVDLDDAGDFIFDGQDACLVTTGSGLYTFTAVKSGSQMSFRNLEVVGTGGAYGFIAINEEDVDIKLIEYCDISGFVNSSALVFAVDTLTDGCTIQNNHFENNYKVYWKGVESVFRNNEFVLATEYGLHINADQNGVFDNLFTDSDSVALFVETLSRSHTGTKRTLGFQASGNRIYSSGAAYKHIGIMVLAKAAYSPGVSITNNTIVNSGHPEANVFWDGIRLTDGGSAGSVSSCLISDNRIAFCEYGINTVDIAYSRIADNDIDLCTTGIYLDNEDATRGNSLLHNQIKRCTKGIWNVNHNPLIFSNITTLCTTNFDEDGAAVTNPGTAGFIDGDNP